MALVLGVAAFSGCGKKDADSKYKVYYVNEDQGEILAESFLPSEEKTSTMVDEMTDKLNKKNSRRTYPSSEWRADPGMCER